MSCHLWYLFENYFLMDTLKRFTILFKSSEKIMQIYFLKKWKHNLKQSTKDKMFLNIEKGIVQETNYCENH